MTEKLSSLFLHLFAPSIGYHNWCKKLSEKYDAVLMILSKLMFAMVCLCTGGAACCMREKQWFIVEVLCVNVKCVHSIGNIQVLDYAMA